MSVVRWSAWHPPEDAPVGCTCRRPDPERAEDLSVICPGIFGDENPCPGFDGTVTPDGYWSFILPPTPPPRRKLQRYDAHALVAIAIRETEPGIAKVEACRRAVAELGVGEGWEADDTAMRIPRGLYNRALKLGL